MENHIPLLKELAVFLVITAILVPLLAKMRINPILGFLFAGIAVGPYGLANLPTAPAIIQSITFASLEGVRALGEIGVVFLLFLIGLEMAPNRLWSMRKIIFGLGSAQVVVCAAVIGSVAMAWGNTVAASIIIGASLALSSTAIVMKMLMDRQSFSSPAGQTSFSILLLQDLAVVPLLFFIALFQDGAQNQSIGLALLTALLKAIGVIATILLLGRFVARPILRLVTSGKAGPEFFMAYILLALLAAAMATWHAGLSMALGAFLAGLIFAETEFRNQIEIDMEPFKGFFMGLFFIFVGMSINPQAVMDNLAWLFASVAGLFAIKAGIIALLCRSFGISWPIAARTGVMLGQAGEFAFVLVGMAATANILTENTAQFMITVTSLTLVLTPAAYWLGEKTEATLLRTRFSSRNGPDPGIAKHLSNHVVIAGFGRTGQAVATIMERQQIPYIGIDLDSAELERLRQSGKNVFFGDASNIQTLQKAHAVRARAIVLAIDDKKSARRMIENIRRHCPQTTIYARARDTEHFRELKQKGVNFVVHETEEMSLQLAVRVLEGFDFTPAAINHVVEEMRQKNGTQQT